MKLVIISVILSVLVNRAISILIPPDIICKTGRPRIKIENKSYSSINGLYIGWWYPSFPYWNCNTGYGYYKYICRIPKFLLTENKK